MPYVLGVCSAVALSLSLGPPSGILDHGAPLGRPLFETQVIDENESARECYSDMVDRVLAATEHPASGQIERFYGALGEVRREVRGDRHEEHVGGQLSNKYADTLVG